MSRIGKLPIPAPQGVTVTVNGQTVEAKGPKGNSSVVVADVLTAKFENGELSVAPREDIMKVAKAQMKAVEDKGRKKLTLAQALPVDARTQWGTARANLANLVTGVSEGFTRTLELVGVGYRAQMQGNDLKLALGLSHDVIFKAPDGIKLEAPKPTEVIISGSDKQVVGEVAAKIRSFRPPEPYKGKGIRYQGEYVRRKEGKKK